MPAAGSVKRRDAHQPVHARLAFQKAVGVFPFHQHTGAFQARFLALEGIQRLDAEAVALAPAAVHAVQHFHPVLRLGAAGPGVEGQDGVPAVVLAGQQRGKTLGFKIPLEFFKLLLGLRQQRKVLPLVGKLNQGHQIAVRAFQLLVPFNFVFQGAGAPQDFLRPFRIVPEPRLGRLLVQLRDFFAQAVQPQRLGQVLQLRLQLLKRKFQFLIL